VLNQHATGDVVPVRELPYGPAAIIAASEAGQMAASDYVPTSKYHLRYSGRPQMGSKRLAPMERRDRALRLEARLLAAEPRCRVST
jgi:hypothetical protein